MDTLQVYSRQGCHLCEALIEALLPVTRGKLEIEVLDIDTRPEWIDTYGTRIPVVEYHGRFVCEYRLDMDAIQGIIAAATRS